MEVIDFQKTDSLISQYMMELRNVKIQGDRMRFRKNLERIGEIMAYEISKRLQYRTREIVTPLDKCNCRVIDEKIVLATIFRAGLPFHQGFLNFFDQAENAFVSAYRKYREKDHDKYDIFIEYIASPDLTDKTLVLVDPMLATGGSMELAYRALLTKGTPKHVHIASVIASQQAVDYVKSHFPDSKTTVWIGAVDPKINSHFYIVPGLGDAGDLAFGTKL